MIKALLKKQFLELNKLYFYDSKKGKRRSNVGTAGFIILFIFVYIMLALVFLAMASMLTDLLSGSQSWIFFGMMGLIAFMLGIFGSVFNTYAGLYLAKDNELLFSMPIPPSVILFSRMTGVFAMSLLYSSIVWIPSVVMYWISVPVTLATILCPLLAMIPLTLLVTVFTCVLGWGVAEISGKLKGRSFVTVIVSLVFFAGYYYVCLNLNELMGKVAMQSENIGRAIRGWLFPIYLLARGAEGDVKAFILFLLISAVCFMVCCFVLSKRLMHIAAKSYTNKEVKYTGKKEKSLNVKQTLFRRELRRFTSSATYMMNCGLGIVVLPAVAVIAIIKADTVRELIESLVLLSPYSAELIPVFIAAAVCMTVSMNCISAPSISLEGKTLWTVQSLPVTAWDVFKAKESLHVLLNSLPVIAASVVIGIAAEIEIGKIILMTFVCLIYVWLTADFGLFMNLKKPNLNWTNEVVPIKQSGSVTIALFGGWIVSLAFAGISFLLRKYAGAEILLCIFAVIFAIMFGILHRWLKTKGVEYFENL